LAFLHAKAVVVDDEAVFITSANFTEAALDRNIELGSFMTSRWPTPGQPDPPPPEVIKRQT
jgi:phosphatidylserine/phosphatidylglycerophosphate/cardiolipin synthase-like enzyme